MDSVTHKQSKQDPARTRCRIDTAAQATEWWDEVTCRNCRRHDRQGLPQKWAYRAPSVKRLARGLDVDESVAKTIRKLIHATVRPDEIPGENMYVARYDWPSRVVHAIDRLIDTHGVEHVSYPYQGSGDVLFEYANTGDSYALTIAYSPKTGLFYLTGWADLLECFERKGYKCQ